MSKKLKANGINMSVRSFFSLVDVLIVAFKDKFLRTDLVSENLVKGAYKLVYFLCNRIFIFSRCGKDQVN